MKSCSDWTKKIRTRSWLQIMRTCEQSGHLNAPSVFVWRGLLKTNPKTLSSNSASRLQSQQILRRMLSSFLLSIESKHQLNFKDAFSFIWLNIDYVVQAHPEKTCSFHKIKAKLHDQDFTIGKYNKCSKTEIVSHENILKKKKKAS